MADATTHVIEPEDAGTRLDQWLARTFQSHSRSQFQKLIHQEKVAVNGQPVTAHLKLRAGDKVLIRWEVEVIAVTPNPAVPISIIFEDEEYLAVSKPAGIVMYQSPKHPVPDTLANWALAHYPPIREVGEPERSGIVHRLDRDVSGVVILAKTHAAYDHVRKEFAARRVFKEYAAILSGTLRDDAGVITLPLRRPKHGGPVRAQEDGFPATTKYEVLERAKNRTLARVHIETGRMHQIRAHFAAIGHPVAGDTLYGGVKAPRLMLHAEKLVFTDRNGNKREFINPAPKEFKNI
ncbi:MAG: RluA family pseudouridine synthase [Patescibacteria group bacterium]